MFGQSGVYDGKEGAVGSFTVQGVYERDIQDKVEALSKRKHDLRFISPTDLPFVEQSEGDTQGVPGGDQSAHQGRLYV